MRNVPSLWRDLESPFVTVGSWRPLIQQLDSLMDEVFTTPSLVTGNKNFVPSIDVEEEDDHYTLNFDMPGMERDDINIELQGNRLTVSGERKYKHKHPSDSNRSESRYKKFERVVTLPNGIRTEDVEAQYHNGVLTLAIPKAVEEKRQRIKIGEQKAGGFLNKLLSNVTKKDQEKDTVNVKSFDRSDKVKAAQ